MKKLLSIAGQKGLKLILMRWLIVPGIGGLAIATTFCWDCAFTGRLNDLLEDAAVSSVFWMVLANGNDMVIPWMDRRWPWLVSPTKRVIISVLYVLVYTTIASYLVIFVYVQLIRGLDFMSVIEQRGYLQPLIIPMAITFFISITLHGRGFLMSWKQEAIKVEQLKNENLTAKFELLKNQVNPHFLFNSLNALTSLVYANQDRAVEFIEKLSEVYRYVLDHQHDELVPLTTELELVKAYTFLNRIRFGDNLVVNCQGLDKVDSSLQLPPLTLQMLLENCFKHNEISKDRKLTVDIKLENDRVAVTNNINALRSPKRDSSKLGMKNIISRYEFLTKSKVEVEKGENSFSVSVPLLKLGQL